MLAQRRLRRWANIETTLGQRPGSAGSYLPTFQLELLRQFQVDVPNDHVSGPVRGHGVFENHIQSANLPRHLDNLPFGLI